MKLGEYARLDAIGLMDCIRSGQISPREAQACALAAIDRLNPVLNLMVGDPVRAPAWEADRPFSGLPFLVKEGQGVRGFPLARGSRLGAGLLTPQDTPYAERLRHTGVALMGATTAPEFGLYPVTESTLHGATRNPWNLAHSPGGSSGGASAAVAAGIVPVAQTSDGGGSIRGPAHCTGIFGLKPSRGRMPDLGNLFGLSFTHVSSRTVRDSAAFLDLTHGPAPGVRYHAAPPERPYAEEVRLEPGRMRVGFCRTPVGTLPLGEECRRAVEETAALLESLGHHVEEASPAVAWETLHHHFLKVWAHPLPSAVRLFASLSGRVPGPDTLDVKTRELLAFAQTLVVDDLIAAEGAFQAARVAVDEYFGRFDLWLSPAGVTQAPRIGEFDPTEEGEGFDAFARRIIDGYVAFTPVFNITGHPAASVPVVHGRNGLPVGVQIAAGIGREDRIFRVSAQLEQASPWIGRRPPHSVFGVE